MRLFLARLRGLGFIAVHARHFAYHIAIGILWAWILRGVWNDFQPKWYYLSIAGSVLPDIDHIVYFFSYGRTNPYTKQILRFLKDRKWRMLAVFIEQGHKHNTDLSYHNIYTVVILCAVGIISLLIDWNAWLIVTGAMIFHYLFDIADDIVQLGYINKNWKRWGNGRKRSKK